MPAPRWCWLPELRGEGLDVIAVETPAASDLGYLPSMMVETCRSAYETSRRRSCRRYWARAAVGALGLSFRSVRSDEGSHGEEDHTACQEPGAGDNYRIHRLMHQISAMPADP
jgi:hypothetical protein